MMKLAIADILVEEGYIKKYDIIEDGNFKTIHITLKYGADKNDKLARLYIEIGDFDSSLNRYEILGGLSKTDRIAFPNENIREGAPVTEILIQTPAEDGVDQEYAPEEDDLDEDLPADDGIGDMTPDFEDVPAYDGENELPMDPVDGNSFEVELPEDFFDEEAAPPVDNGGGT